MHDVIDANTFVAIVVIVRLPKRAEGVDRHFVVVAKIPGERFHIATIRIAAEHHSHAIGFAVALYDTAIEINHRSLGHIANEPCSGTSFVTG